MCISTESTALTTDVNRCMYMYVQLCTSIVHGILNFTVYSSSLVVQSCAAAFVTYDCHGYNG